VNPTVIQEKMLRGTETDTEVDGVNQHDVESVVIESGKRGEEGSEVDQAGGMACSKPLNPAYAMQVETTTNIRSIMYSITSINYNNFSFLILFLLLSLFFFLCLSLSLKE